jgi:hypothetical protein
MHRQLHLFVGTVVALTVAGSAVAAAGTPPNPASVRVQQKPSIAGSVHISFRPTDRLSPGGYYYAVIVLRRYKRYTRSEPPPCATSSDMEKTDYAYPHAGPPLELALTPAKSSARHWCRGGVYSGGIYAVPYPPPCDSTYPCRSEPYKAPSPCFEIAPGRRACGVVAKPELYRYPDELPRPLAKGTRIIAHFQVTF